MIMPRSSDQLLLPVNPLFVWLSLLIAFALNIVPLGRHPSMHQGGRGLRDARHAGRRA